MGAAYRSALTFKWTRHCATDHRSGPGRQLNWSVVSAPAMRSAIARFSQNADEYVASSRLRTSASGIITLLNETTRLRSRRITRIGCSGGLDEQELTLPVSDW